MIQYKFELSLPWREDRRTLPPSLWLCHSSVSSETLSVRSPSLPLFANPDTDWQVANSGNVKQGLAKAALSFWSELCLLAAAPIVISRKTLLIIQIQEIKCGWLFCFLILYSRSCCATPSSAAVQYENFAAMNFSTFKLKTLKLSLKVSI